MFKSFILFILFFFVVLQAYSQQRVADSTYNAEILKSSIFLDSIMKAQNIPGLSIAVTIGRKMVWKEAFGYANINSKTTATTDTKFRVGSISKSMTAFAMAKLFDESQIDWDDNVDIYFPQFEKKEYSPTIRQIAGHQGGVRHYKGLEFISKKQYSSVEESMEIFMDDKLLFKPGTEFKYSTYGYTVLSRIIEIASDQDYLDYMSSEIYQPLGMSSTFAENSDVAVSNVSQFYRKGGRKESGEVNLSSKWAGGGFLSTPTDLVMMITDATKIISAQTLFELINPQNLTNGEPTGYGMGFRINVVQSNDRTIVHHGGKSIGARSFLMLLPAEQMVIAICTNTEADYGIQEVYDIAKIFLRE